MLVYFCGVIITWVAKTTNILSRPLYTEFGTPKVQQLKYMYIHILPTAVIITDYNRVDFEVSSNVAEKAN